MTMIQTRTKGISFKLIKVNTLKEISKNSIFCGKNINKNNKKDQTKKKTWRHGGHF